jgi:hypothetical protein
MTMPPFRAPHHTSSYVSIVGGGANPRPGEATLAHKGVLFMDEFPEFERRVVEALRQPLEDRVISVARAKGTAIFPARFTLVAAMNPCPCGNYGHPEIACICSPDSIRKISPQNFGPDRRPHRPVEHHGPRGVKRARVATQAGDRDRSSARARTARTSCSKQKGLAPQAAPTATLIPAS